MNPAGCCAFPGAYDGRRPGNVQLVPRGAPMLRYVCGACAPDPDQHWSIPTNRDERSGENVWARERFPVWAT